MFGYLRVADRCLDEARSEMYRAHFCATCHAMVEFGGRFSSLLTNYDVTFWLSVATALEESQGRKLPPQSKPCTAVPFRQVWVHPMPPQVRRAMAALNLALVASKVEDNRRDGDHRLVTFAFKPLDRPAAKAIVALREMGFPAERIEQLADRQSQVEARDEASLEEFAQPTRELMGEIFAFLAPLLELPQYGDSLRRLGQALGRLLYLLDALCDVESDRKKGAFNALVRSLGYPLRARELAPVYGAAVEEFESALAALPLGQTEAVGEGLVVHLRQRIAKELERWKAVRPSSPSRWSWQRLRKAGFLAPVRPQCEGCDCGGCDGCDCSGCDCSGCDGCGSCGSCDACSCGSGEVECCCDASDVCSDCCDLFDDCDSRSCRDCWTTCCCCYWGQPRPPREPKYNIEGGGDESPARGGCFGKRKRKKKKKKNAEETPAPTPSSEPEAGTSEPAVSPA